MVAITKKIEDKDMANVLSFFQDDTIEPFDIDYQNRFLHVFISDRDGFPEQIVDIAQPEYFDAYQKLLLDYELKFFNQYKEVARFPTLKDIIREKERGMNQELLLGLIDKIEQIQIDNVEYVKNSAYRYFKERSVKNCLFELVTDWKKHNYDSMKTKLENALKAGEPKETGHNYVLDVIKRLSKDFRNPITALPSLDPFIGGGLSAGEMGVILAQAGGGKSMFLVALAANAFLSGKKVLYYTLELAEEVVGQRFDSCINNIHLKNVWDFPDIIQERAEEIFEMGGELIVKKFISGQATINTLMAHIRTLETHDNFKPDIIFIDYGDLLKPVDNFTEKRHALDSIYVGIRGMADELRIPIWNAAQTGRSGMDTDKVSLSSIAESLGNARTADVILSVGRDPEEVDENPLSAKIGILKNRNGQAGIFLDAIFDTSKVFIEIKQIDASQMGLKKKKPVKEKPESIDKIMQDPEEEFNKFIQ